MFKDTKKTCLVCEKNAKEKSSVEEFAQSIKNNPKEIIDWAKREIEEYQKLIKILQKNEKEKNENNN